MLRFLRPIRLVRRTRARSAAALVPLLVAAAAACAQGESDEVVLEEGDAATSEDGSVVTPPGKDGAVPTDAPSEGGDAPSEGGDACSVALAKLTFDFESGTQGWTQGISDGVKASDANWPFDPWGHGTASKGTACKAGKCFGAELAKNYTQCQRGYVLSPAIDLTACMGKTVALVFHHAYAYASGTSGGQQWFDGAVVEVSGDNGQSWSVPQGTYPGTVKINPAIGGYECIKSSQFGVNNKAGFVGKQTTTTRAELTLPSTAVTGTVRVRFSAASGVSQQNDDPESSRAALDFGWRIDDVAFVTK